MDSPKRPKKAEPTRECQYGAECYRKNPQHFGEYAHKHLSDIRRAGRNSATGSYTIPDALRMSREIVAEQLAILEQLFPLPETAAKRAKTSPPPVASSSSQASAVSASAMETNGETAKKAGTISASQLKNGLKLAADSQSSTSASSASSSTNSIAPKSLTQAEQLAAYRQRHTQQRPATSASASASATASSSTSQVTASTSRAQSTADSRGQNPHARPPPRNIEDYISVVNPRGKMAEKLAAAAPYNFFLTTITAAPETHKEPLSITFQEILDPSLGAIESSVQMNFMIDIGWLLGHYYFAGCLDKPILVLYGDETPELQTISTKKPQVTAIKVQMSSPFGTHHTKMMLLGYADGSMRVVVSTANLLEDDWHNRTQGLWISPRCPRMPDDADTAAGVGPTGFRDDLVRYLVTYNIARLQPWIARVRRSDFSAVNVFFVASVPGGHRETPRGHDWGHPKVGRLLGQHCAPIADTCALVAQSSSIGTLGAGVQTWIMADVMNSFRRDSAPLGLRRLPQFRMVYPSYANVRGSHDGLLGGGCLPYRRAIDVKQPWLKTHLCQWKSSARHRSRAMPHIKTYCRWSERGLYWFLLTSANLSKAAWGAFNKTAKLDTPLRIMSYEAGVLFLPKFVLATSAASAEARFFPLSAATATTAGAAPFPMPYDVELQPYAPTDTPFVMDYLLEQMQQQ